MASRRGDPLLPDVVAHRLLSHGKLIHQGLVVKGKHDIHRALGAHLNAALADLVNDVVIVPVEERRDATQGWPIDLTLACEHGVASGSPHRLAVRGIAAVPHHTTRPGLELVLPDHAGGDHRWPRPSAKGMRCSIREREPRAHVTLVHPGEE